MRCPTCQTVNAAENRFCTNCGTRLAPPDPNGAAAREGAPRLEGERKHTTVLFADVAGSTTMAERIDPERWTEVMNVAFDFMRQAVERYGGTVSRYMGDGVLALFGYPTSHEDDPERAVRAGLDIVRDARDFSPHVEGELGQAFQVRVGVNTGESVVTTVGQGPAAEVTVMGDAPNVAARLQGHARPDSVVIGQDTEALVRHSFELEELGPIEVRGRSEPVAAHRVLRPSATPGRLRGVEGLRAPLVGRQRELGSLRDRARELRNGRGGAVAVVGEAGVGKSRLVAELRKHLPAREVRWLEGRALSYAQGVPYFPWRQVLLASIGASDADDPVEVRTKLRHEACSCCSRPGGDLPYLETVVAVESEESLSALAGVEAEELVPRITEATQGYICSLAAMKPTVVAFDDLHWADPATIDLIAAMADVTQEFPLLVLCVMRPERDVPSWRLLERLARGAGERFVELQLEPLGEEAARQLLDKLLDVKGLPDEMRDTILQRAEGNPFFLEEVLRSLIDSGHVVRDGERWHALDTIAEFSVPDTLAAVLDTRFDRLPEETKRVAQVAAVIGRSFPHSVLAQVVADDSAAPPERAPDLEPHLGTLSAEDLVRERARQPEREYAFKHALTHQAVYDRLLFKRRRELHKRTGLILERLHGSARDDVVPILAHHFTLGEEWERAGRYGLRAGARAFKLNAFVDARRHYDGAVAALERSPEAEPQLLVDALLGWTEASILLRDHEHVDRRPTMIERAQRAVELARGLGDKVRLTQALVALGNVHQLSGFPGTGFEPLLEAQELARELGDDQLFLLPFWAATEQLLNDGPERAARQFDEVVALAREVRNPAIEAHALASKSVGHARIGEFADARLAVEDALEVVPRSHSIIKEADVNILAGMTYLEMGELEKALAYGRRGAELAMSVKGFECACGAYQLVGMGELQAQQWLLAQEDLVRSIELGTGTRMEPMLHQARGAHAAARVRSGEIRALSELETERAIAERMGDGYGRAALEHEIAEARLRNDDPAGAESAIREALGYFRERVMRPYVVRALETLAVALDAQARDEEAEAARAEAERIGDELRELARRAVWRHGAEPDTAAVPSSGASGARP